MAGEGPDRRDRTDPFDHEPVMIDEIVGLLAEVPRGTFVDATVGGGGHSDAVLERHRHLTVLGIDQDADALDAARRRLARHGERVALAHARFDELGDIVAARDIVHISGFLFDLGVSSPQLDRAERGFSYQRRGPLDMRMDRTRTRDADDIVNHASPDELTGILRRYGDERFARRIAQAIVAARPVADTVELAEVVVDAIPAAARGGRHPARRTFQAIRMEVNDELPAIERGLTDAIELLGPGGRGAVIAYHSGEDRVVKRLFDAYTRDARDTAPNVIEPEPPAYALSWRGARRPDEDEAARNPRAASARLRGIERRVAA